MTRHSVTVLCTLKGNLDLEFIQQPEYISVTNKGKVQKAQILVPRVLQAVKKLEFL